MSDTTAAEDKAVEALGKTMSGESKVEEAKTSAPLELLDWEVEDKTFDFEEDFQDSVAALTVMDPNFMLRTRDCVEPGHFENAGNAILVNIAQSYYDRYARLPGKTAIWAELIRDGIKSKQIRANFKDDLIEALKKAQKADLSDSAYFIDKLSDFSKHQDIMKGLQESVDLASRGEFLAIERRMQLAFQKGAKGEYTEGDYWEDEAKRTQTRKDIKAGLIKPNGIPIGIPRIDEILHHKGLGRKEVTVLMAGAKKGKSMGLGDWSLRFSKQGYNTLYVTCEVSVDIIAERMDANVSRTDMGDLVNFIDDVSSKVDMAKGRKPGVLKIVEFPAGTLTPSGLQSYIERHKAMGIHYDTIVVDYADIMAPNVYTNSDTENSKQVWLGLRAIATRENVAMLTATQTNREGFKSDTAKAEHAAEDFNKVRIADLIISINRTDEERDNGEARLFFAASRNQAGEFTIHIKQDLAKMAFIESVTRIA